MATLVNSGGQYSMSISVPDWFKKQEQDKIQASIPTTELQKRWQSYSGNQSTAPAPKAPVTTTKAPMPSVVPQPVAPGLPATGQQPSPLPSLIPQPQAPVDDVDPLTKFNKMVFELLQNAQKGQLSQKSGLQDLQNANAMAPASSIGIDNLAPGDNIAARSRLAGQYEPAISNINDRVQLFNQTLNYAKELGDTYFKNVQPSKETIEAVKVQLRAGFVPSAEVLEKVGKYLTEDDWMAAASAKEGSTRSNQAIDNENQLRSQFLGQQIVKDYNVVLNKKLSIDGIVNSGLGGPADLGLVYEFMKALDPNSVVRETEYATAAQSGNIFSGAFAKFNGYFKPEGGFLPENVKRSFQELVNKKLEVATQQYRNVESQFRTIAERQGLDPNNVIIGFEGAVGTSSGEPVDGERRVHPDNGKTYQYSAQTKSWSLAQ